MFYWYRRAFEIHNQQTIEEREDGKVDDDAFEAQKKRLYKKIEIIKKREEGFING